MQPATAPTAPQSLETDNARWAEIDAEIDSLCSRVALSDDTRKRYAAKWADWVRFCQERGHDDPFTAPFTLFEALIGAVAERRLWPGRQDRPCAPGKLAANLSAIAYGFDVAGVTPAYRKSVHEHAWQDLLDGYRRRHAAHHAPLRTGHPVTAQDAYDILTVEPSGFSRIGGAALTVLLALLAHEPASEMGSVPTGDIIPADTGDGVTIRLPGDRTLCVPCNHPTGGHHTAGFEWGCPACTLARAADEHPPSVVLGQVGGDWYSFGRRVARHLVAFDRESGRPIKFTFTDDSTPEQREGAIRVLCHAASPLGLRLPYVQARLVGCWAVGLSALAPAEAMVGADVDRSAVGHVEWRLPGFDEPVTLPPTRIDGHPGYGVPEALTQWASIRAAVGATDTDPFFGTLVNGNLPRPRRASHVEVAAWVRRVTEFAGIPHDITPGTTQVGFIREAHKYGLDDYDIAAATNRTSLEHVSRHTSDARKASSIRRLLASRAERKSE